jgi:flavorubredoxin
VKNVFNAVQITDKVYWVGAIDWTINNFHGYETNRGTTYNAYLILADKITLIDTVKEQFSREMLEKIASIIEPSKIDYIVSNHAEMDHSGALPEMIRIIKPEKVFASNIGISTLKQQMKIDKELTPVKDMEKLSLGNMELCFIETRMLHWPDSMFTYLGDEKILFSQDAFGMHLATYERFAKSIPHDIIYREAAKYYANILLPYSNLVQNIITKLVGLNLPIEMVLPDHGPIWKEDFSSILEAYKRWAEQKPQVKAVIAFDTMWNSTNRMAKAIGEGLYKNGVDVRFMPLSHYHRSDVITELLDAGALVIGSPTLNNGIFPTVADLMTYVGGLKPKNLIGASFGSFGWSGEAVNILDQLLTNMKIELVDEGLKVKYAPDDEALKSCFSLGMQIGNRLKEIVK